MEKGGRQIRALLRLIPHGNMPKAKFTAKVKKTGVDFSGYKRGNYLIQPCKKSRQDHKE
jgi:hypothetical protein